MNRATPLLGVACLAVAAANFAPDSAPAQVTLAQRLVQIDKVKCEELLSRTEEARDRLFLYFNGYVDGMRRHTTWDERAVGQMIDRALGYCKADPSETILSAFTRAAR
jgi:HdeA/HdeB family